MPSKSLERTSNLVPGSYRLVIEVRDRSSGQRKKIATFFELATREEP